MVLSVLLASLIAGQVPAITPSIQDPAAGPALLRLAVELSPGEPLTPIPAEPGAPAQHALVYAWFRLGRVAARAASLSGTPLDANRLPAALNTPRLVIVGLPVSCGGRSYPPSRVQLADRGGASIPALGNAVSGPAVAT